LKNFDEARFVGIQSGAVALQPRLDETVRRSLERGADSVFFLGTGGAGILMEPAALLLAERSTIASFCLTPAELCALGHARLSARSLVVMPSLSGTTRESITALEYVKSRGATVLVLAGNADSPLARGTPHAFINPAADDTSSESFYIQALLIALSLMNARAECSDYARIVREIATLPALLLEVKRQFETEAARHAQRLADHDYHIISSAGGSWPEAHYYGMCILEEMQWIRTRPVHAANFFHGTLELVEKGVHVLLFKGEDGARPLVERVEKFCREYTDLLTLLDARSFALPGISADTRALLSPVLLATVLERVSAHLEVIRDHPLTTRRYYKRVAY
jgi:fructoselysine-6-phosphate deglycase